MLSTDMLVMRTIEVVTIGISIFVENSASESLSRHYQRDLSLDNCVRLLTMQ